MSSRNFSKSNLNNQKESCSCSCSGYPICTRSTYPLCKDSEFNKNVCCTTQLLQNVSLSTFHENDGIIDSCDEPQYHYVQDSCMNLGAWPYTFVPLISDYLTEHILINSVQFANQVANITLNYSTFTSTCKLESSCKLCAERLSVEGLLPRLLKEGNQALLGIECGCPIDSVVVSPNMSQIESQSESQSQTQTQSLPPSSRTCMESVVHTRRLQAAMEKDLFNLVNILRVTCRIRVCEVVAGLHYFCVVLKKHWACEVSSALRLKLPMLFTVCVMIAHKNMADSTIRLKDWARCVGMGTTLAVTLERIVLVLLDYDLSVPEGKYEEMRQAICK